MGIREMGRAKGVYGTGVEDSVWSRILGIPEECGLAFSQTRDSLEGQCPCASCKLATLVNSFRSRCLLIQ